MTNKAAQPGTTQPVDIQVVKPETFHVEHIAANMREADRVEIWSSSGVKPLEALKDSLEVSSHAWCGTADGVPVCIFGVGVVSILEGRGSPWLLGTDDIERHGFAFARRNRKYIADMLKTYERLENWVDDRNTLSKRWLRWMGFTLHAPVPYGMMGELFCRFEMTRNEKRAAYV